MTVPDIQNCRECGDHNGAPAQHLGLHALNIDSDHVAGGKGQAVDRDQRHCFALLCIRKRQCAIICGGLRIQRGNQRDTAGSTDRHMMGEDVPTAVQRHVGAQRLEHQALRLEGVRRAGRSGQPGQLDGVHPNVSPDVQHRHALQHDHAEQPGFSAGEFAILAQAGTNVDVVAIEQHEATAAARSSLKPPVSGVCCAGSSVAWPSEPLVIAAVAEAGGTSSSACCPGLKIQLGLRREATRSTAMRATTPDQSCPNCSCRFSRTVGYQGVSVRSSRQGKCGAKGIIAQVGTPKAPARCSGPVHELIIRSSPAMMAAVSARSVTSFPRSRTCGGSGSASQSFLPAPTWSTTKSTPGAEKSGATLLSRGDRKRSLESLDFPPIPCRREARRRQFVCSIVLFPTGPRVNRALAPNPVVAGSESPRQTQERAIHVKILLWHVPGRNDLDPRDRLQQPARRGRRRHDDPPCPAHHQRQITGKLNDVAQTLLREDQDRLVANILAGPQRLGTTGEKVADPGEIRLLLSPLIF